MTNQTFSEKMLMPVKMFLARRMRDCKSTVPVLGEMLDRKLPIRERISIRLHLFTCKYCTLYLEQIRFLRQAIANKPKVPRAFPISFGRRSKIGSKRSSAPASTPLRNSPHL